MILVCIVSVVVAVLTFEPVGAWFCVDGRHEDSWLAVINPFASILAFGSFLACLSH
jgi:hypothetical protein